MEKIFIILIIVNLILFHKMFITIYSNLGFGLLREVICAAIAAIVEIYLFMMGIRAVGPVLMSVGVIIMKILIVIAGILLLWYIGKQIIHLINRMKMFSSDKKSNKEHKKEAKEQELSNEIVVLKKDLDSEIKKKTREGSFASTVERKFQELQNFVIFVEKKIIMRIEGEKNDEKKEYI